MTVKADPMMELYDFGKPVSDRSVAKLSDRGVDVRVKTVKRQNDNLIVKVDEVKGQAMEAAKAEVKESLGIIFNYDGLTYTVKRPEKWPIKALKFLEDQQIANAIAMILGPDQWDKFAETHTVEDASDLFEEMNKAAGMKPGE